MVSRRLSLVLLYLPASLRRAWSMIPKKPAPDLIRGGGRFSEKIMLKQKARAGCRSTTPHPALGYELRRAVAA